MADFLNNGVMWLLFSGLGLDPTNRWAEALHFFIYDSIKIIFLLFIMVSILGVLRSYIPYSKLQKWLSGKNQVAAYFASAVFGAVTPFCTCSSIPFFISMIRAGVPIGVAFSFLVTSPVVDQYIAVIMLGLFGWKITVVYILLGIVVGTLAGILVSKLKVEKYLVRDVAAEKLKTELKFKKFSDRLKFGVEEGWSIAVKMWYWVLLGVGLGAIIHNLIPDEFIHGLISSAGWFSVPLATLLGVPLYANCAAIVPIALVLFQKGIPLGTALAFMMAASALSLPEAIILRRAMKLRLILLFFGIVAAAIMLAGFVMNLLQPILV